MKKRVLSVLLVTIGSAMLMMAGCKKQEDSTEKATEAVTSAVTEEETDTETETTDEASMTDGYYYEESTGRPSFYRFNEDGTYYASLLGGGVTDAGTYELKDEELEYYADGGKDGDINTLEDNTIVTAKQVIEIVSYKGGEPIKMAFDNNRLCDISLAGIANHRNMDHVPDYPYNPEVDEVAIEVYLFYANESAGSTITLSHNRTFMDVTGDVMCEGTWEMLMPGEFILVYEEEENTGTLNVSEDGKSAVLVTPAGEEIALVMSLDEEEDLQEVVLSLTAVEQQVGLPMGVDVRVDCYADETCKLIIYVAAVGADLEVDAGTYTISPTYQFEFQFETAGTINGTPNYETANEEGLEVSLIYVADGTVEFNGAETALTLNSELKGVYSGN